MDRPEWISKDIMVWGVIGYNGSKKWNKYLDELEENMEEAIIQE
jgi:hypothetical protein